MNARHDMSPPSPEADDPPVDRENNPACQPTVRFDDLLALADSPGEAFGHAASLPEMIGPYLILEQIGAGGMGMVFRAEQRMPIRREVAIKSIKLGMDTKAVIARFEAERQALAMMDHPHIAKVFDAGADEWGRPYFVMEYVRGNPITEYADKNHLTIPERLELFEQVCQAVQHAHHKGIIHRDIKPSNVLVSTQDGRPYARVIDFGIAKATSQQTKDFTALTRHDQLVGTPQYMSPEQAVGSLDIDTRTDIYSLGVVLYELLAGSTPFTKEELRSSTFERIRRMILDVEPPRPSLRLTGSRETLPAIAASRGIEPRRLGPVVRGELDWIVMKALEKDRRRRYETPTGLARDLQAYRNHEPVLAAPPGTLYRLRKSLWKYRKAAVAAGVLFSVVLIGLIMTSYAWGEALRSAKAEQKAKLQLVEARDQLQESLKTAISARQLAEQAQQRETEERSRAERHAKESRELAATEKEARKQAQQREAEATSILKFVQDHVFSSVQPQSEKHALGPAITLRETLVSALPAIDTSFPNQPLVEGRIRLTLANALHAIGEVAIEVPQIERAQKLLRTHLGEDHPETFRATWQLASCYGSLGRPQEVLSLYEKLRDLEFRRHGPDSLDYWELWNNIGVTLLTLGRKEEAGKIFRRVLSEEERLFGPDNPALFLSLTHVSEANSWEKQHEKALEFAERALTLAVNHRRPMDIERAEYRLADVNLDLGNTARAIALMENVVDYRRKTFGIAHPRTLQAIQRLSEFYYRASRFSERNRLLDEIASAKLLHTPGGRTIRTGCRF